MGKLLTVRERLQIKRRNPNNADIQALLDHAEELLRQLNAVNDPWEEVFRTTRTCAYCGLKYHGKCPVCSGG